MTEFRLLQATPLLRAVVGSEIARCGPPGRSKIGEAKFAP